MRKTALSGCFSLFFCLLTNYLLYLTTIIIEYNNGKEYEKIAKLQNLLNLQFAALLLIYWHQK